ncbi:MAG: Ig-like domain-containing protein [Alistipes sp.]|nr:Ig-like domain-containing protein [Alistipes sp.]
MSFKTIMEYGVKAGLFAFLAAGLLWRCGHAAMPQGGPKDTLPPVVVAMNPHYGVTGFDGGRIFIEFDEYIQLKDQQKEFFTSPRMAKKPSLLLRGKGIQIDVQDSLRPNTTYALNFGSSIADNNEGNPLYGFRYVFSTGDQVDSMYMSGYAVDAFKKDSVSKAFIFFYEASKDSIALDSTVFNFEPDVIARAENNGIFIAENLKPIPYRVYAIEDNNGNQTYEPGTDGIAFLDSVFNPADMPAFEGRFDTTRSYYTADPQLYFRVFRDKPFQRQYLSGSERPLRNKIVLTFGAPYPQVDTLMFEGIPSGRIITEFLKPTLDSVALWINMPPDYIPDTIRGRISYMRHDSINQLVPYGQDLVLGWRVFESRQQERERLAKEKEREKAIAEGLEVPREPSPFKFNIETGRDLNPENDLAISFDYPLIRLDTTAISLIRVQEEDRFRVRFTLEEDPENIRRYLIRAPWINGENYELEIPAGALANVAYEENDTIRGNYTVMVADNYATLIIQLRGKTPQDEYILELLDQSGNRVIRRVPHAVTGTYTFRYLDPGTFRLRIVEDVNGNGEWDTGSLVERRQPERVEMFSLADGEEISIRMGWDEQVVVDCNVLFAPITMRSVMEQIRRQEEVRLRRLIEERARRDQEQNKQPQNQRQNNSGFGTGSFNPSSAFNL